MIANDPDSGPALVQPMLLYHPDCPLLFDDDGRERSDSGEIFSQVLQIAAANFEGSDSPEVRDAVKQVALANLWFFLKFVAAYNGPYEKLTTHLHVDMSNFYQLSMRPGSKASMFIFRSAYKSSVVTHGANTWEITRNPELEIGLGCAIEDRALSFLARSQETISDNELYEWLFPDFVPRGAQKGWNSKALTLPNKRKGRGHPNIKPLTVGGSTAGQHFDLLKLDDIVGDTQLTSQRMSGEDMYRIRNWFLGAQRTLLKEMDRSRVFVTGTRYAADDPYESIMEDLRSCYGYWEDLPEDYRPKDGGEWDVYYRQAVENNVVIFPEALSQRKLDKIREEDFWTFMTQYMNNPYAQETAELSQFETRECFLDSGLAGIDVVVPKGSDEDRYSLADMDVVIGIDPAASESKRSARTSRSAVIVWATDWQGNKFAVDLRVGYVKITDLFDWMFEMFAKWRMYVRSMALETQGPFKILGPSLQKEQNDRGIMLPLRKLSASGDKEARIRSVLTPLYQKGRVFAVPEARREIDIERRMFPNSAKLDVLDAMHLAESHAFVPPKPRVAYGVDDWNDVEEKEFNMHLGRNVVTGY